MSPTLTQPLTSSTVLDLSPPPTPLPARRTTVLGSFRMTVEIVRTEDIGGDVRVWVETRSGEGRPTSSVPFDDERKAMIYAMRLGI